MVSRSHKLIVVTGATRGLGRAIVEKMIALGHSVAGCGRSSGQIEELRRSFAAPHDFDTVDVANDAQVRAWAGRLLASHGAPDLLVNNAGLMNRTAPPSELQSEEIDPVIDVNIKGVVNVIRHFAPAMIARQSGVIVNLSSGWGRSTAPEVAPYCATKWAIEGLTQALAQELPRGLAAVALNPGVIDTDMLRSCWADDAGNYPRPAEWTERAVPFVLRLGPRDNGKSLTAPGG